MMSGKKSPRKQLFEEVEADTEPMPNANVHGAIISISPVSTAKSSEYLEALLSNSIAQSPVHLVGFGPEPQGKLAYLMHEQKAAKLGSLKNTVLAIKLPFSKECSRIYLIHQETLSFRTVSISLMIQFKLT